MERARPRAEQGKKVLQLDQGWPAAGTKARDEPLLPVAERTRPHGPHSETEMEVDGIRHLLVVRGREANTRTLVQRVQRVEKGDPYAMGCGGEVLGKDRVREKGVAGAH